MDWTLIKAEAWKALINYGPKIILAIVVLIVGLRLIKIARKIISKQLDKKEVDKTASKFITDLLGVLLKIVLFISVLTMFGVETTSFVAILGAAGLAVGLALQGSLQNFAGGVLLLIFKPYKIGDFIEAQGETGSVKEIQIFTTVLTTPDLKTIIIPNGAVMNGNITNYSNEGIRRVDLSIGVGYGEDLNKAKEALTKVLAEDSRVLKDPAPVIGVTELGDSAVTIGVMPYAKLEDYWGVYFDTNQKMKEKLDEAGIEIPFPQMDVTVKK